MIKKLYIYCIITLLLSCPGYFLVSKSSQLHFNLILAYAILMWGPGTAGFICQCLDGKPIKAMGWRIDWRFLLIALFIPILYSSISYCLNYLLHFAVVTHQYHFSIRNDLVEWPLIYLVCCLGEEVGWRGYLVPLLLSSCRFTKTCFITGIIWGLWHFPILLSGVYLSSIPSLVKYPLFIVATINISFMINYLRLRSASILTATVFHASHNMFIQQFLDVYLAPANHQAEYFMGETGITMTITMTFFAVAFLFYYHIKDRKSSCMQQS